MSGVPRRGASKRAPLPTKYRVEKRPLIRPAIVSPYAGKSAEKIVYVGSRTPFMAAFKRVKYLLEHVDKREMQSVLSKSKKHGKPPISAPSKGTEEVMIKASGKAIEKALALALFIQNQSQYIVKISTGTATSIDDIVEQEKPEDVNTNEMTQLEEVEEVPEMRLRNTSVVQVAVGLR